MGNIVTPDQGLLPLPAYSVATTPYPWWLNAALAIWALLALLCCWLLLLLYLLRYCCKWWRHQKYAADRQSLRERFFGAKGRGNLYATRDQHFATAPLPPVPPYAISEGDNFAFRDIYEHHTIQDDFYDDRIPYVTAAPLGLGADSESYSEEEIARGKVIVSDKAAGGVTENIETNIQRNITKNYYINEEQNYFIQKDLSSAPPPAPPTIQHDQEIQRLPAPTVTTINMAAERITDNPSNWEDAKPNEDFNNQKLKQASAEVVRNDPSLFQQDVKYEKLPNIFTHRSITPESPPPQIGNRKLGPLPSVLSDDGSTTSEMSGHDSESIYETIRIFTPKKSQPLIQLDDEDKDGDDYKTAGIDEVEIEIQDLVRLQKANPKSNNTYDDILSSTNMPRQRITPRVSSSISSSSTLNNLIPISSQHDNLVEGEEEKEETVTETIKTQQIQTTFRQIGQNLDDSAFFIPLTSSSNTHYDGQTNDDRKIIIPISASTIAHDEQPALQHF